MKLRLRSLQSNQTLKLEVLETCTLHDLAQILSESIPSPPPSTSPPRFSLNRKEELLGSSPVEPLRSLGITSGDLIYFSYDANHFSPVPPDGTLASTSVSRSAASIAGPGPSQEGNKPPPAASKSGNFVDSDNSSTSDVNCGTSSEIDAGSGLLSVYEDMKGVSSNVNSGVDDQPDFVDGCEKSDGCDSMDIDAVSSEDVAVVSSKRFSEPYFLRRVLREELVDCDSHHKLLVAAIHAVFLESGFVGYDSFSRSRIHQLHIDVDWPLKQSTLSIFYTLPELLGKDVSVVLKFQTLGNFLNAFGSSAAGGSNMHRLCLNANTYAPTLRQIWQLNCRNKNMVAEDDESITGMSSCENEVFKFWKDVKDGLCLPLLIDLCEKAGLAMPSCFSSLPTDLKLSILTLLPGVDIARMECVSMETRYLSSNNELWKQKFAEEFGNAQLQTSTAVVNWKQKFASEVVSKKKRKRDAMLRERDRVRVGHMMRPVPRNNVGRYPLIWGGDHDLTPGLGIPSPFPGVGPGMGAPHHFYTQYSGPSFPQRGRRMPRNVRTDSDLERFNGSLFGAERQW